jgi:hypothetical protein
MSFHPRTHEQEIVRNIIPIHGTLLIQSPVQDETGTQTVQSMHSHFS